MYASACSILHAFYSNLSSHHFLIFLFLMLLCVPATIYRHYFCLLQKWLCHFWRPFLETGCIAVFHSWSSLARCWVPATFGTTSQIDGMWYDRILYSKVLTVPYMPYENSSMNPWGRSFSVMPLMKLSSCPSTVLQNGIYISNIHGHIFCQTNYGSRSIYEVLSVYLSLPFILQH
jgi:hypothetical protein